MYGKGKSERLIGETFKDMRNEIIISTKYGYDFEQVKQIGHTELPQQFDDTFTRKALKDSLDRLIDMYGLHNPKMYHIKDDSIFSTLDKLVEEEKIKAYQIALGPAIGWTEEGLESMKRKNVTAVQTVFNI
jgi:aryl-alcohol dehydrogenase-like predicted oxidoreductase